MPGIDRFSPDQTTHVFSAADLDHGADFGHGVCRASGADQHLPKYARRVGVRSDCDCKTWRGSLSWTGRCCFVLVSVPKNFPKAQWALRILTRIKVEGGPDGKAAAYSIAWSPVADGVELMGEGTGGGSSLSMKPATSAVSALKFNDFDDSNAALQTPVEITMTTGHMTLTKKLLVEVKDARTILADIPTDLSPKREIKPLVWEGSGAPRSLPRATELVVVPVAGH
jgi:hypothetical protein